MKSILLATILVALLGYVAAECNNMCSGHGICGANDACTCYRNWRGNDCSERNCQFGIAFVDTAQGDLNHNGQIDLAPSYAPLTQTQILKITVPTTTGSLANNSFTLGYGRDTTLVTLTLVSGGLTGTDVAGYVTTALGLINADFSVTSVAGTGSIAASSGSAQTITITIVISISNPNFAMPYHPMLTAAASTNTDAFVYSVGMAQIFTLELANYGTAISAGDSFTLSYAQQSGIVITTTSISISATHTTTATNIQTVLRALTTTDFDAAGITVTGTNPANNQVFTITIVAYSATINPIVLASSSFTVNPNLVLSISPNQGTEWSRLVVTQWAPQGTWESQFSFHAQESHAYMECSNKGLCDRSSGECVCFPGYEGSSCQRTTCPNGCSGHGLCRTINDLTQTLPNNANEPYPLWDGLKNQACVCDAGFGGIDCSSRLCRRNADPLIDGRIYETQKIVITNANTALATFKLKFVDTFGESWTTTAIDVTSTTGAQGVSGSQAYNIATALTGLPNGVIQAVTVTCDYATTTQTCTIQFSGTAGSITTGNAGNIPTLAVVNPVTVSSSDFTVTTPLSGTNVAEECSARGLCQYDTGVCKCFRGYRTDDCHLQHALAF